MSNHIFVRDLAKELGMDPSHARKYVIELGIEPFKVRKPGFRGSPLNAITPEQADIVRRHRADSGFVVDNDNKAVTVPENSVLYVVDLEPAFSLRRIKVGIAVSATSRLANYRTTWPKAVIVKTWPCQRSWETAAMAAIGKGEIRIAAELFETEEIEKMIERGDAFFDLMPIPVEGDQS